jgi:hypothetical protein
MPTVRGVRPFFPRRERKAIERLACDEPASVGRSLTHGSLRSLAQAAVEEALVDAQRISHAAVGDIVRDADLKLHGFRYWRTTIWDDAAVERALKILWYYERIESLWHKREVAPSVGLDEKPNLQVLERAAPKQPMRTGQLERPEFRVAYHRHGRLHWLAGLTVYHGPLRVWSECLEKNDGEHFRPALCRFLHPTVGPSAFI